MAEIDLEVMRVVPSPAHFIQCSRACSLVVVNLFKALLKQSLHEPIEIGLRSREECRVLVMVRVDGEFFGKREEQKINPVRKSGNNELLDLLLSLRCQTTIMLQLYRERVRSQ